TEFCTTEYIQCDATTEHDERLSAKTIQARIDSRETSHQASSLLLGSIRPEWGKQVDAEIQSPFALVFENLFHFDGQPRNDAGLDGVFFLKNSPFVIASTL